jgi:hypothetical protein
MPQMDGLVTIQTQHGSAGQVDAERVFAAIGQTLLDLDATTSMPWTGLTHGKETGNCWSKTSERR